MQIKRLAQRWHMIELLPIPNNHFTNLKNQLCNLS